MGRYYAHRRYGPAKHSLGSWWTPTNPSPTFLNSWYALNEVTIKEPDADPSKVHIPSGFLHDIIDDNRYNSDNLLGEGFQAHLDSISGYNVSMIYNQMGNNTVSPAQLIENLKQQIPVGLLGNTPENYDVLKLVYGF